MHQKQHRLTGPRTAQPLAIDIQPHITLGRPMIFGNDVCTGPDAGNRIGRSRGCSFGCRAGQQRKRRRGPE